MLTLALVTALLYSSPMPAAAQFGISSFTMASSSSQAGSHPNVGVSFALAAETLGNPVGQARNATVSLPTGLIGDPRASERCSQAAFQELRCTPNTQVGVLEASFVVCQGVATQLAKEAQVAAKTQTITVTSTSGLCADEGQNTLTIGTGSSAETVQIANVLSETTLELEAPLVHAQPAGEAVVHRAQPVSVSIPLFDLEPTPGHAATLGASLLIVNMLVQMNVTPRGGLVAKLEELSTLLPLHGATLTLWGVPASPEHDSERCNQLGSACGLHGGEPAPFVTNPTDCDKPSPEAELRVESWSGEPASAATTLSPITGCQALRLAPAPTLRVTPATTERDTPSGYRINVQVPQNGEPEGLATPAPSAVEVTLPEGVSLSPAFANGLQECGEAQFSANECPPSALLGSVEMATPLLAEHLTGGLYIATPTNAAKYRVFLTVDAPGAVIHLTGQIEPNPTNGQVTAVFEALPQLPFSELTLNLFGGPSAPLANPQSCGPATSTARIVTYAGQSAEPSATFTVDGNGVSGDCPDASHPFAPRFVAGTAIPLAAGFSPFTLSISREDGEPYIARFTTELPPGLQGMLGSVDLCPEPQAARASCGPAAQVGTATIAAGAGPQPLSLSGPVYLTGPYDGAPFGLAITVNATAGPFDLGTVMTRARVLVNPTTLALTVVSDPLPQVLEGVPLRVRSLAIELNRPDFLFNPSDCKAQQIAATVTGSEGAVATLTEPFRVSGCASLRFAPKLIAATAGKAGALGGGVSLALTITDSAAADGLGTAISSAIVEMPAALRPRLSAIQNACLQTSAGPLRPSACPPQSQIGTAVATTPMLARPLSGVIYLVTHGGTSRPSLALLLNGDGINAELTGTLAVSPAGSISVAFRDLPDVPVSRLTLELPRGSHAILGATTDICTKPLKLSYQLTAQSDAQINATAHIAVNGCPRHARRRARHRRSRRAPVSPHRRRASSESERAALLNRSPGQENQEQGPKQP